jgi:hypothetical protein
VPTTTTYTQINTYSPSAVLTSKNGQVLLVGYNADMETYLKHKHIENINVFVSTSNASKEVLEFQSKYHASTISEGSTELKTAGDFTFMHLYANEVLKGVYVEVDNVGIVIAFNHIGSNQSNAIRSGLAVYSPQILFQSRESKNFLGTADYEYVVSSDKIEGIENNFATKINGTFTFSISNGIITETRSEN